MITSNKESPFTSKIIEVIGIREEEEGTCEYDTCYDIFKYGDFKLDCNHLVEVSIDFVAYHVGDELECSVCLEGKTNV